MHIYAQTRQLDEHEHGTAQVMKVIGGKQLQIEFEVPSESSVGFEYFLESKNDRKGFAYAINRLSQPTQLFKVPEEVPIGWNQCFPDSFFWRE